MRSLNTTGIMVVGGGLEIFLLIPWFGAPPPAATQGPTPPPPPAPEQWRLREYLSPDDIWRPVQ